MVDEQLALDPNMDYHSIEGLRSEVKEKLAKIRPTTVVRAHDYFKSGVANELLGRVLLNEWKV
jgi:tRNA U34 5-carboxymethylaminomethyl modifying enzyme MnmG/GidA